MSGVSQGEFNNWYFGIYNTITFNYGAPQVKYSGPGVNTTTGFFNPSEVGTGLKTISYTYTNVYTCSAIKSMTILVQPAPAFICGNNLTDIRDNKVYATVLIGLQCWTKENLDFGFGISDLVPQTDNCVAEKFIRYSLFNIQYSTFYQWDELMRYDPTPSSQGLCPPGWHVPTSAEWDVLVMFYNGSGQAGGPMKDTLLVNGFQSHQQGFLYLNNTWAFTTGNTSGTMFWTLTTSGAARAVARGLKEYNPSVKVQGGKGECVCDEMFEGLDQIAKKLLYLLHDEKSYPDHPVDPVFPGILLPEKLSARIYHPVKRRHHPWIC